MPAVVPDAPLSFLSSANSSFDGHPRKSHDKTLGGVFAYTNGTAVDSALSDHKLDSYRSFKNGSLHSLPNGVPNGSISSTRDRSHSKAGSTHSTGTGTPRQLGGDGRTLSSSDGLSKLSQVEHVTSEKGNGSAHYSQRTPELGKLNTDVHPPTRSSTDDHHVGTATTAADSVDSARPDSNGLSLKPGHASPLQRFSSPAAMSPGASYQDRYGPISPGPASPEAPKLTHRHTLQVPRTSQSRPSREFSFSGGPSEEALSATGHLSPTHGESVRHRRASLGLVRRTTRSMQSDAARDEVMPDEDAMRWTEAIRQKRASKRKKKDEEDEDRVVVGTKVDQNHVNWVTAYNMLTGIRFTVSRTNAKIDRELTDADFAARHKFSFDITGNELTPSAKYDFKFKDYSPWVFRHLRTIFGLDPADYLMSLTSKYILSELGSPGKSGSFFYFSRDYKYIIKTIHHAEHKLLRKILKEYFSHVVQNPNTLISQFYGLHRVKIAYGRKIHFVVMNNLFPPHRDIHQMFDLKGSTVGRDFKEEDLEKNPRATLKDLNWLRRDYHLEFNSQVKQLFVEQMTRDVALLQKLHIMDYSMLVGIHDLEKGNEQKLREATLKVFQPGGERGDDETGLNLLTRTPSRMETARKARELRLTLKREKPVPMGLIKGKMPDEILNDGRKNRIFYSYDGGIRASHENGDGGEEVYYLGIIDCLTHYGFVKRAEHFWKGLSHPSSQISPIPPEAYGDRFINFITGVTMTKEEAERRKISDVHPLSADIEAMVHSQRLAPTAASVDGPGENEKEDGYTAGPRSPAVEKVMTLAHRQADKHDKHDKRRRSEDEIPDRTLGTTDASHHTTLPVVEEAGEAGSVGGRSGRSDVGVGHLHDKKSEHRHSGGIRHVSASTTGEPSETEVGEKPPYLDIPPPLSPLYDSPRVLEPQKSIVDGHVGYELLPGAAVGARQTI